MNITVKDEGSYNGNSKATAYTDSTHIASQNITLTSGNSATLTFVWNTTGFAKGNYTISANAWSVPNETYTVDNTYTAGMVTITIPGDINGDGVVNIFDASIIGANWGATW